MERKKPRKIYKYSLEFVGEFKQYFFAKTGVRLDFRKHGYLHNSYGLTPCVDYDFGLEVVQCLYVWAHQIIKDNKQCFPQFDGWIYNPRMEVEKLRTQKISTLVFEVCDMLFMEYTCRGVLNDTNKTHKHSA